MPQIDGCHQTEVPMRNLPCQHFGDDPLGDEQCAVGRFNPVAVAISLNATFVARTHTGVMTHMIEMMQLALEHKGFSFLEVLQPCVTYNKVNTLKWYREKSYDIAEDGNYDPTDRVAAWKKSLEWEDGFPIGVLYTSERPAMADNVAALRDGPLNRRPSQQRNIRPLLESFR